MADHYWEQRTTRQHSYINADSGRVIGSLFGRLATSLYEAHAYDKRLGDYADLGLAYAAVEAGCVEVEEATRLAVLKQLAQRAAQADGDNS